MSKFSFDVGHKELINNLNKRRDGLYLICLNCGCIKKCIISFDDLTIKCIKCGIMLPKDDEICDKIEKRFEKIIYKINRDSRYDVLSNLSDATIENICNIIRFMLYSHINMYGLEKKMFDINYLLMKIFNFLDIDLGVSISKPKTNKYEKYFDNLIKYCYDSI